MRGRDVGAKSEEAFFRSFGAETAATCPVLEAGLHEMNTNQDDSWTCDDWWEDPLERLWRQERNQNFSQRTNSASSNESAVCIWTR